MLRQNPALADSCENRPKKLPCTPNERQIQKMKADMRSTAKVTNWPTRESHLYLKGSDACWLTHFHREKKTCFAMFLTEQHCANTSKLPSVPSVMSKPQPMNEIGVSGHSTYILELA